MGGSTVISGEVGPRASITLDELDIKNVIVSLEQQVVDVLNENDTLRQKEDL